MAKTRSDDSTEHSMPTEILLIATTVLGGVPAVVVVEVPWTYFTTWGETMLPL